MDAKYGRLALALAAWCLLAVACGVDFNGSPRGDDEADWDEFDYVFSGDSPDPEGEPMLVRLNVTAGGAATGNVQSIFWAEFAGELTGRDLELTMTFKDNRCADPGHASFVGTLSDGRLVGHFQVWACEWSEFDYDGELVGGRQAR